MSKAHCAKRGITTSLFGAMTLLVFSYMLAKHFPDIVRYIKISCMCLNYPLCAVHAFCFGRILQPAGSRLA